MANIVTFRPTAARVQATIHRIARHESGNVIFHLAQDKGFVGDVSMSQAWVCLEKGCITPDTLKFEEGEIFCEINYMVSAQRVFVALVLENESLIRVLHVAEE